MNTKWMAATLLAVMVSGTALAQQKETEEVTVTEQKREKKVKKEESIIVRKKGDSKEKITIVVDGEKVSVNGKPIEEFKDENVEIIRSRARNGYSIATFPRIAAGVNVNVDAPMAFNYNSDNNYSFSTTGTNKAFLGVTSEKDEKGARITSITKGSAAEKAGLKKYDIITKIGDTKIENDNSLHEAIGKYKPEDKVVVTYNRDGAEATVTATLGKNKTMSFASTDGFYWTGKTRIGLQVQDVEEGNGVKVLDVDDETPAAKAGLKENDIITEVDGKELKNVDEFKTLSKELKDGDALKVKYKRDGKSSTTEIKIPKKLKTANL